MDALAQGWLREYAGIDEIVVFGSFTTGKFVPGSDLDVCLLVTSQGSMPPMSELMPLRFPVPLELFVVTRAQSESKHPPPIWRAARASSWRYVRERLVGGDGRQMS